MWVVPLKTGSPASVNGIASYSIGIVKKYLLRVILTQGGGLETNHRFLPTSYSLEVVTSPWCQDLQGRGVKKTISNRILSRDSNRPGTPGPHCATEHNEILLGETTGFLKVQGCKYGISQLWGPLQPRPKGPKLF